MRVLLTIALLAAISAHALTLEEAIREARSAHPLVRVAEERIRVAEGLREQAALSLNPRFFLQSENTRFHGSPAFTYPTDADTFAYFSQIFEAGGKRERRVEVASSDVALAGIERALLERQIAGRVSLAYWTAVAAARIRDLIQENVDTYDRLVQYHRDRVREGAIAEVDLLRVELERDRTLVTVRGAEAEYGQAIITLLREMGRNNFAPVTLSDTLSDVTDLPAPDYNLILPARPEIQLGREGIERARRNLSLQQANAKPDPELLFGYKRTGGFDTMVGGFQINLPMRNRNQGQIASASAQIRIAENALRAQESQVRAEVESAWQAYQFRRRLLTETLKPMQDRAAGIARISLAAYQEGGFDLLRLIDAQRARIEAMNLYYRGLSEYQQSVTTLRIVSGAPF